MFLLKSSAYSDSAELKVAAAKSPCSTRSAFCNSYSAVTVRKTHEAACLARIVVLCQGAGIKAGHKKLASRRPSHPFYG